MPKTPSEDEEEDEEDEMLNQSDLEQDAINTYYAVRMGHNGHSVTAHRREREGALFRDY